MKIETLFSSVGASASLMATSSVDLTLSPTTDESQPICATDQLQGKGHKERDKGRIVLLEQKFRSLQSCNQDLSALLDIIHGKDRRIQELTTVITKMRSQSDGNLPEREAKDSRGHGIEDREIARKPTPHYSNFKDVAKLCRTIGRVNYGRSIVLDRLTTDAKSSLTSAEAMESRLDPELRSVFRGSYQRLLAWSEYNSETSVIISKYITVLLELLSRKGCGAEPHAKPLQRPHDLISDPLALLSDKFSSPTYDEERNMIRSPMVLGGLGCSGQTSGRSSDQRRNW